MSDISKVQVKLGGAEFSAEGPREVVNAQYDKFLAALAAVAPAGKPAGNQSPPTGSATGVARNGGGVEVRGESNLAAEVLNSVFVERNGYVTLRSLPQTESRAADAALLILYGYRVVNGLNDVTAVTLGEAVRMSGITVDRLGRLMAGLTAYVRSGGLKRSTRYTLNNQGLLRAEEIITQNYN